MSGGRVETRPAGSDIDATIPPAAGCARRCRRGKHRRLGFAIAGGLWCLRLGHGIRTRFVAQGRPGSRALIFTVWFWVPSVGGDWPGLAPGRVFLVATRKSIKKRAPAAAPASRRCPRSTRVRRVASKLALRYSDIDATIPPAAGCARRCRRGKRCRLGFAIAGGLWCLRLGHGIRARFVARRRPGSRTHLAGSTWGRRLRRDSRHSLARALLFEHFHLHPDLQPPGAVMQQVLAEEHLVVAPAVSGQVRSGSLPRCPVAGSTWGLRSASRAATRRLRRRCECASSHPRQGATALRRVGTKADHRHRRLEPCVQIVR